MARRLAEIPITRHVWDLKYRARGGGAAREVRIEDTFRRVARAIAAAERPDDRAAVAARFARLLGERAFLPGGRILAGAGTARAVTLFNCFVMGPIEDSLDGILLGLRQGGLTMQRGGGVGYDFSTLRPRGSPTTATMGVASGPVSFMELWDTLATTLMSTTPRRGAMMATLRCDHPDIEEFIDAKRAGGRLTNFNLSVQVTDAFVAAVRAGKPWPLVFPHCEGRKVPARELWRKLTGAAYASGEPGVLYVDRINRENNLWYRETITATNPCGEVPLPPYGACNLGSLNLVTFVRNAFTPRARLDLRALASATATAVRFLDDVIDVSPYPLPEQEQEAKGTRRVGLGITGLADALVMLGRRYDEAPGRQAAADALESIRDAAYQASIELAAQRGSFPLFAREPHMEGPFIGALPARLRRGIAKVGIRNSHLLAIAPAGTISLLADNVSSGVEPLFAAAYERRTREPDGGVRTHALEAHSVRLWRALGRARASTLPPAYVDAASISAESHIRMQAALQPFVDAAISKTVHVSEATPYDDFLRLYDLAYDEGLKGFTVFRSGTPTGHVLTAGEGPEACELLGCV